MPNYCFVVLLWGTVTNSDLSIVTWWLLELQNKSAVVSHLACYYKQGTPAFCHKYTNQMSCEESHSPVLIELGANQGFTFSLRHTKLKVPNN